MRASKRFLKWPAIQCNEVTYLFGQGGYIECVEGQTPIAYIMREQYKLRTPTFSERVDDIQELPVSWGGLDAMTAHLKIASSIAAQKRLVSYKRVFPETQQNQGVI